MQCCFKVIYDYHIILINCLSFRPTSIDTSAFYTKNSDNFVNIHRSNQTFINNTVDKYSAGCQVFNNSNDFQAFIRLCEKQKELYGNSFTYTLINEEDL